MIYMWRFTAIFQQSMFDYAPGPSNNGGKWRDWV